MTTRRTISVVLLALCLVLTSAFGQPKGKTKADARTLKGKVVDVAQNNITVDHDKVEGFMDAMIMAYKVDRPESLRGIKKGDMITATVYSGDFTLYDIKLMPPAKK
jgi:Cu/Ag efflux protein CusF